MICLGWKNVDNAVMLPADWQDRRDLNFIKWVAGVCAVLKSWVDCCFWLLSCHADLSDTGWRGQALTFSHYVIWIHKLSPYFCWLTLCLLVYLDGDFYVKKKKKVTLCRPTYESPHGEIPDYSIHAERGNVERWCVRLWTLCFTDILKVGMRNCNQRWKVTN